MDLDNIFLHLNKAKKKHDSGALKIAYDLITAAVTSGRISRISPEVYVVCAEAGVQLGHLEISRACLKMFFEGKPPVDQLLSRAYLCQGQLQTPPSTGSMDDFEEAVQCFLKAIEISTSEPRYHYRVFNASVQYFQAVHPLLRLGQCQHLVPSLRQVVQSLEEVADQDYSWRAELMMHLITCLVDSGKMEDAVRFAKVTEKLINSHIPHLYPRLFTLLVRHKLTERDVLTERSSQCTTLSVIYNIQEFKNRLKEMNEDESKQELEQILHLLVGCKVSGASLSSIPAPIQPADRAALLLELALLALQVKHQTVAANCLKALKLAGEASVGQHIIMECVNCEINLLKRDVKMNDYSKASVEARLKEIGKLDQWLKMAVKEKDPLAMQVVCATQWSFCLPLLQHNLRKHIKTPLLNVAKVLEDMQSMLLEMRCQVHSELAAIEEEEVCLEASLTHLQKALLLDNGTQRECLLSAVRLLQLRGTFNQMPSRTEDKAAMLMQQVRDMKPQDKTDIRSILVSVGLLLAPDEFQTVLDADNTSKGGAESGPVVQLCVKAQHHSASVCKVDGHLARQGECIDCTERVKLWGTLVKTAWKWEAWDVCRAACRFCLLYDDGRWKSSKNDKSGKSMVKDSGENCHSCSGSQTHVRNLLQLLAEIHFINAEATIHKLLTEGVRLNSPAVPPVVGDVVVSEDDPQWVVYRDWIQALSTYATSSFLRAAELGAEIREPWVVENAVIYLWNYSSQLMAAGEYQRLLPSFQTLVEILKKTENIGNRILFVLLCDTVAQGLIQPLTGPDPIEPAPPGNKGKNKEKEIPKTSSIHRDSTNSAVQQDVCNALKLCEYALEVSNCNILGESVPIAVRKQAVATWVHIKKILQQQIGSKLDIIDKCQNEDVSAMTRVLVGVEMLLCNRNPRHMEFSVPSLSTLVNMASECNWPDAVVELQVWCQLAAFCYNADDHRLLLRCAEKALKLEKTAAKSLNNTPCVFYGLAAVNEMLSTALCLKGLGLVHKSSGDLQLYSEAMKELLSSVSYAEKAENRALCVTAARHYWNTCLRLIQIPEERWQLQKPLEKILVALVRTSTKNENKKSKVKGFLSLTTMPHGGSTHQALDEQDLILREAVYGLLLCNHVEKTDRKAALELLNRAVADTCHTRHQLHLLKQRILLKAQQGITISVDMQKLREEGEKSCSSLWHQAAVCAGNLTQQLTYYKKSISSVSSADHQWQKASFLLDFGEWLYCQNFPKADGELQVQLAIDILLQKEPEQTDVAEDDSKLKELGSVKRESLVGPAEFVLFTQSLSDLKEVRRLDSLVRAHTLLAVMADKTSPEHQLNLLRAYTFVLQIWQVSMAACYQILIKIPEDSRSDGPMKGKEKGKGKKMKDPHPAEEKIALDQPPPATTTDWACYVCPEQARQIFKTKSDPHCINIHSITKQTQSLFYLNLLLKELQSLSLAHLTLPILHLAETIASDLLDIRSLSDVYQLRIVRTCCQLGLHSPYQEKLLNLTGIHEQELMECRKVIAHAQQKRCRHNNQNVKVEPKAGSEQQSMNVCIQHIWLDKAEVCVSLGFYQAARQLLSEAHLVSMELRDQKAVAKSLLISASLACEEQNFGQALLFLDKAQVLKGEQDFWYQFTLTKVRAVGGQKESDTHIKVDQVIKQGCDALKLVLEQRINQIPEVNFLITSLEMRGAVECIRALGGSGEPGTEVVQRLMVACETLRECASVFHKLGYREHAVEAHAEAAHCMRVMANHASNIEDKEHFLLDGLAQIHFAVSQQEQVVLNAQALISPQQESRSLPLTAMRRLLHLRGALTDFSLTMLEEHCAEKTRQALARERMTAGELALEEFIRCTPEPNSIKEKWLSVGSTLQQVALGQLNAVSSQCQDDMEAKAHYLTLRGKYFKLLAMEKDPLYLCALWDRHAQPCTHPEAVPMEEGDSERGSARGEPSVTSAPSVELQQEQRYQAQRLLVHASQALTQAISLCLQYKLPSSILADAALTMSECHGQSDPALTGQHLALFQSSCVASTMAVVLSCSCPDTSVSQLSSLLSLHRDMLRSQEESPNSMLKGVEVSLSKLSKAYSHLTINSGHLDILAKLPSNLNILLLQHSKAGSELYGAYYEMANVPVQKGKMTKDTGALVCSRVAKISVCPQALQALRDQAQVFSQETKNALLKKSSWHRAEEHQKSATDETLESRFRIVVQHMEDYLNPLLTQFEFCFSRPQDASPELLSKTKEKEISDSDPGEYVVLLTDMKLMDLPLEALAILQDEGICSVSRDFSLQLLHSRLTDQSEKEKAVASNNKKGTKGGKGTKGKQNQRHDIKEASLHTVPSNALTVDSCNFKYIVDPTNKDSFGGTSLSTRVQHILEKHNQHFTHLWKGFMGNNQPPSLPQMEQLLCTCSGFFYLGTERFAANIPPAKLAALNLSGCRVALLFDLMQNHSRILGQSKSDKHDSERRSTLDKPLDEVVLLSLAGVGCVVLNQWNSCLQQGTRDMECILEKLLRVRLTFGQALHALRRGNTTDARHHEFTDDQVPGVDLKEHDGHHKTTFTPSAFNCILYGLPNLAIS